MHLDGLMTKMFTNRILGISSMQNVLTCQAISCPHCHNKKVIQFASNGQCQRDLFCWKYNGKKCLLFVFERDL